VIGVCSLVCIVSTFFAVTVQIFAFLGMPEKIYGGLFGFLGALWIAIGTTTVVFNNYAHA